MQTALMNVRFEGKTDPDARRCLLMTQSGHCAVSRHIDFPGFALDQRSRSFSCRHLDVASIDMSA